LSSVYQRGTPISVVERFWRIDPITRLSSLADPTTVTFTILAPDDTEQVFVWPGAAEITNPSVGVFVCALTPPLPPGEFRYLVAGTGAVVATREDSFTILESGVLPPDPSGVATPGPCSSWINGDDVDPTGTLGVGSDTWRLDDVAYVASHILYELSGRQFPGVCTRTVRPCRDSCGCWDSPSLGLGPWAWTTAAFWSGGWGGGGWGWYDEDGQTCGCGSESYIRLAGYPVREILEVKIGGVALATTGEYRLDDRRNLIRLADVSDPASPIDRFWPACQDLSLDDSQPGTYSVRYTWGADVPAIGRMAAAQLARELWKATPEGGGVCQLPTRVTRVVRQGITMEKLVPTADLLRSGTTGLQLVDAFLATVNPSKMKRRSLVWSPDIEPLAREVGQD